MLLEFIYCIKQFKNIKSQWNFMTNLKEILPLNVYSSVSFIGVFNSFVQSIIHYSFTQTRFSN